MPQPRKKRTGKRVRKSNVWDATPSRPLKIGAMTITPSRPVKLKITSPETVVPHKADIDAAERTK